MTRTIRVAMALILAGATLLPVACNTKDEGKTKADLTLPDIPPSSSKDGKKGPTDGPGKNK